MDQKDLPMETEICHNCKREVPQQNYLMHVAHCARNVTVCPVCGDAVPKAHLKEHRVAQHSLVECKDCRHKVQKGAMEHHKETACGKRKVACAFCELELPKSDMSDHENYCGSRTERCDECGELVMLKYEKLHIDSNHGFLKLDDEPGPTPSWEIPPVSRRPVPLNDLSSLAVGLSRSLERNVNTAQATALVANKTDYKTPIPSEPFRDMQRSVITPYDATEDLRAKVKLVRHDLNEIKQSYLMSEERKERQENKYRNDRFDMNVAQIPKKTEKFVTNLVPYEKNQSFKINASPVEDNPKNYYNYLGEKETPPKTFMPRTDLNTKRNLFFEGSHNGEVDKTVTKTPVVSFKKNEDKKQGQSEKKAEGSSSHTHKTGALPKKVTSPNGAVPKREHGSVTKRRKAPQPPVSTPKETQNISPPSSLYDKPDEVILPCEFCEKMIPTSELVQHETGCRPDLAQFKTDKPTPPVARPNLSPEVQLPCEFCFSLYPASKLLTHQGVCDVLFFGNSRLN